jgi:hypothetical protein
MRWLQKKIVAYLVIALAGFQMAGCAKPYDMPDISTDNETVAAHFPGIFSYAQKEPTRVIWLHGMCKHGEEWAINRNSIFAKSAGLDVGSGVTSDHSFLSPFTVKYNYNVDGNPLEMNYLVWSPLTIAAKASINDASVYYKRAKLNARLKDGLINDCFSDAVIYSGPAGDGIRQWVKSEICVSLGGKMRGKSCMVDPSAPRMNTIFVAESLGSKMLSDAVLSLWEAPENRAALAQQLSDVQMVFYLANQIPLLGTATYGLRNAKLLGADETDLMQILAGSREREGLSILNNDTYRPLHFISITDPSDLLSYPLRSNSNVPAAVRVTNVVVSNDHTYLGLLERPDTAHCGYGWNPNVLGIISRGYDGSIKPVDVDVPKKCGLGD